MESETPLLEKPSPVLTPRPEVQDMEEPEAKQEMTSEPPPVPPPLVSVQEATPLHERHQSEEIRETREQREVSSIMVNY